VAYPDAAATEDVAVILLASPASAAPRALATGWAKFEIVDGAPATVAGYGTTDGTTLSAGPLQATVPITDATCVHTPGCNVVGGELAAGGMGIDACPGDSGGPLLVGGMLAGVVSRGIEGSAKDCGDGSIYARADAIADWLAAQTMFVGGPAPSYVDGIVVPNDPHDVAHTFAIASTTGKASVDDDGRVHLCAPGASTTVVSVTDATDATRSLTVAIAGQDETDCAFVDDGCRAARDGSPWLVALLVIGWLRWPTSGRSARRARTTSASVPRTGCAACPPATAATPATSSARSRAGTATSRS